MAASVCCNFCGHQQWLNPEQLAQLSQYQHQAARLNVAALQEVQAIAQMQALHGGRGPQSRHALWIAMACTSTPILLAVVFVAVGMANGISNDVLKSIAQMIVMVGFFVGVGAYFLWYYSGARKTVLLPRATQAAICPSCGAPTAFTPGQVIGRCRFCSATAVPGAALQRAGLDAAEHAARVARLERYRAERRVVAGYASIANSTATIYPWIIGISVGLPIVGMALYATHSALTGDESVSPGLLGLAWLMALSVVVAAVLYLTVRSNWRKKWHRVHDQLAAKLNGVTTTGSDAAQNWMDVFWACPFPVQDLMLCNLGSSTLGVCLGYPVLLLVNPVRSDGTQGGRPAAEVLLAARFPGYVDDSELPTFPPLDGLRNQLGMAGYTLRSYGGGLHASASSLVQDRLTRVPDQALELVGIAEQLAQFASAARAQAVPPMAV